MRFLLFLGFVFMFHNGIFSQTDPKVKIIEAKDIPVDTVEIDGVNSIDNELIIPNSNINDGVNLVAPEVNSELIIPVIEVPVFNLEDDPKLAAIDSKWMDLIRFYEQFDASSMFVESLPSDDVVMQELTTEVLKKRLAAIDAKTPFNLSYNTDLETLIKSYIKNRSKTISRLMAVSKYYFPLFEEKLDMYDVPLEVKYLAIVESALQPKARSRVGATGLWQFMYETGKQYGLDVTSYIDKRQDPIMASEAASKHLSDLYDIFEDWDLALAAYNSGAGNVNKAIRRAGGKKNYWNIRLYLPRETASYVPIFYATLYLFEYGDLHGIIPDKSFNWQRYEVDTLYIKRTMSFEQIKTTTGIDVSLLEFLNPIYKLNIIPYDANNPYHLVLPKEYVGKFLQNEDLIYAYVDAEEAKREKPLPENVVETSAVFDNEKKIIYHRVKRGEYLGRIADKYNVSVSDVRKWNRMKGTTVHVNQKLKIYKNGGGSSEPKEVATRKESKPKIITHTVKKGDTIGEIAEKYNVAVADIKKWNKLKSNIVNLGSKLKIYAK